LKALLLLIGLFPVLILAEESYRKVQVSAPYIELHTGPAAGYPIDYVVERGEWISVLKRRTDWFRIRTKQGREGWVSLEQLQHTQNLDGSPLVITGFSAESYRARRWEMGFTGGQMSGAALLNLYGGYVFTSNLSTELGLSHALGDFSSEYLVDLNLLSQPFPEWRYAPFFTLGSGMIFTRPNTTLVQSEDRSDTTAHVGLGLRAYLSRRFFLRGEFRHYTVFTSRNENEEFNQWKIGLGVFF
jgi:uncharacterized protein YgiM (DUF1202 family)